MVASLSSLTGITEMRIIVEFRGHFTVFSLDGLEDRGEYYTQLIVL